MRVLCFICRTFVEYHSALIWHQGNQMTFVCRICALQYNLSVFPPLKEN